MKKWPNVIAISLLLTLLSGCMYPNEMKRENQVAAGEYMMVVQNSIDQFKKATGVLPIKNRENDTPIYEKYLIDFKKLKERNFISTIPANAFENGGTSIYVLINPETKPEVKLMDLTAFQKVDEVQKKVDEYISKNNGALPKGDQVAPKFYVLDFGKLGTKREQVLSVYTRSVALPLLVHESGKVVIDYAIEIMKLSEKKPELKQVSADKDLREELVANSYYVPVHSFPYHWVNGQPVVSEK